jgi:hypothetical protein
VNLWDADQSHLLRPDHGAGAAVYIQLAVQIVDMLFDCRQGYHQPIRDLLLLETCADQAQNLQFKC